MSLKTYVWKIRYRSSEDNLLTEFYIPALERSVIYKRSAGYFSTESLVIAARGISHLIRSGGKMQLVVSPSFSEEDIVAIKEGYSKKEDVILKALDRSLIPSVDDFVKKRLEVISWMIANELLDIKIACTLKDGKISRGIFHEKVGIFEDGNGDYLTFSGSPNESENAYIYNFESFDVQKSWEPGLAEDLAKMKRNEFSKLWEGRTSSLDIVSMPTAIKEKILVLRPKNTPIYDPEEDGNTQTKFITKKSAPGLPRHIKTLREHQVIALEQWKKNKYRGILQHATGSGKTITALNIAVELLKKEEKLAIIVLCPQKHIVDQWGAEAREFGFSPILGYESSKSWINHFNQAILDYNMGILKNLMFITTNASFSMDKAQSLISKIKENVLLIGDEVHNLGAKNIRSRFIDKANFRLGLSATPERWYDDEGTKAIYDYFGSLLKPIYGIKEAIEDGYLCKYRYYIYLAELTDSEAEEYYELSHEISRVANFDKNEGENCTNESLKILLSKRARLIGKASNKLIVLKNAIKKYKDTTFNLFYCGDGKIDDERQIELVCKMLGLDVGMSVEKFTAEESQAERESILRRFKEQETQGLVAIKCLDEGVNVPNTQRAFILASSSNPRQFIQRRGRILRSTDNKEKIAEIHDFFVVPPNIENAKKSNTTLFNVERRLVRRELMRSIEFSETAENGIEASGKLLEIRKLYNLLDV